MIVPNEGGNFSANARRWCNHDCIYVDIDSGLESRRSEFQAAVDELNARTKGCFDLRDYRTIPNPDDPFIWFRPSSGCSSYVGYVGCNYNPINIAPGCSKGAIIHELMHSLGAYHEHQRPDRNSHITLFLNNIQQSTIAANFNIPSDATGFGAYDYSSLMHYGSGAFAKSPGQITISTIDATKQNVIGQRQEMSAGDVRLVDFLLCKDGGIAVKPVPELECSGATDAAENYTLVIEPPDDFI